MRTPNATVTASTAPSRSGRRKASAAARRGAQPALPKASAARRSIARLASIPSTRRPGRSRPSSDEPLPQHRSRHTRVLSGTARASAARHAPSWPSDITELRSS